MPKTVATVCWLLVLCLGLTVSAADKTAVRVERIGDVPQRNIDIAPSLITADTCFVSDNDEITTRIDGWVIGFELYKSLMIPENQCPGPYPFTVTAINMPMIFDGPTPLTVAVDIELVDSTTVPGCPIPGVLVAMSAEYETMVSEAGLYNIWVPLDTPYVVEGPFFAGFYIGNQPEASANVAVLTDDYPIECVTFNIWDEAIGWIDMANNAYYNFPGRLAMEVAGIPGGSGGKSPQAQILAPADGAKLYGETDIWAWDEAFSGADEYVTFEYSNGGAFNEIARDFDGTSPLRDGVNPAAPGTGYSAHWNLSGLAEGNYTLRATIYDGANQQYSSSINVYVEPTPPTPIFTVPEAGGAFCPPVDIEMSISDENVSFVEIHHQPAEDNFSLGLTPLAQSSLGDANGNAADGNPASGGEYGDYYSAPAAAAMMVRAWVNRGYNTIGMDLSVPMTDAQIAEQLAQVFLTRTTLGSYDEAVFSGLSEYAANHYGGFYFDQMRLPSYSDARRWVEDEDRTAMIAIGGSTGLWMAVDGFSGWRQSDSTWLVRLGNPFAGTIEEMPWRHNGAISEIQMGGTWYRVDMMVSMIANNWSITRTVVGVDFSGTDGWGQNWSPAGLTEGSWHYLYAIGHDYTNNESSYGILTQYDCTSGLVDGDFDNDGYNTLSDLMILIEYVARDGAPPFGGAQRADCNCDNQVNIADIIYYMNYLFGAASPPCR